MINLKLYFKKYDWFVNIYYMVDSSNIDEIVGCLQRLGSGIENNKVVNTMIKTEGEVKGYVYSNCDEKESILLILDCCDGEEFLNVLLDLIQKLTCTIAKYYEIEEDSDLYDHLLGSLTHALYFKAQSILKYYKFRY